MLIEYKKPTAYIADSGTDFSNPAQAYDGSPGDETTCADQYNAADGIARWHTWASKVETYTATQLHVKWKTSGGFTNDTFAIEYTKNGGGAWLELVPMGVHNETTIQDSNIALDANQDLAQVEVRVNVDRVGGGDKDYLYIYDIWTEGEYTAGTIPIPVNQTVSKVVMLAVTVLTGVAFLVGQVTAKVTPYSAGVKSSSDVPTNQLIAKVVPYEVTVVEKVVPIPVNQLIAKIIPYSPIVESGQAFIQNLQTIKIIPYSSTVKSGVTIDVNLLISKVVPHEVTVETAAGAPVQVNLLNAESTPYSLTVDAGIAASVNLLSSSSKILASLFGGGANILVDQLCLSSVMWPLVTKYVPAKIGDVPAGGIKLNLKASVITHVAGIKLNIKGGG